MWRLNLLLALRLDCFSLFGVLSVKEALERREVIECVQACMSLFSHCGVLCVNQLQFILGVCVRVAIVHLILCAYSVCTLIKVSGSEPPAACLQKPWPLNAFRQTRSERWVQTVRNTAAKKHVHITSLHPHTLLLGGGAGVGGVESVWVLCLEPFYLMNAPKKMTLLCIILYGWTLWSWQLNITHNLSFYMICFN